MKALDLTGKRFGLLTAEKYIGSSGGRRIWKCECICGGSAEASASNLTTGNSSSCGCKLKNSVTKHGKSFHPLYKTWIGMWQRCTNINNKDYENYGGRGISVCAAWIDIDIFISDVGERPEGATLDREDNDKDYGPNNCRWSTRVEQVRNRRVTLNLTFNGETLTVKQWSEKLGITYRALYQRINALGWSVEKALTYEGGRWPKRGLL